MDLIKVVKQLRPGAAFYFEQPVSYASLVWLDESQEKPTEQEVIAKLVEIQQAYEATEYQRQRQAEYPSFADQFDLLYHGGYDAWKAAIDTVKNKYPKPE